MTHVLPTWGVPSLVSADRDKLFVNVGRDGDRQKDRVTKFVKSLLQQGCNFRFCSPDRHQGQLNGRLDPLQTLLAQTSTVM